MPLLDQERPDRELVVHRRAPWAPLHLPPPADFGVEEILFVLSLPAAFSDLVLGVFDIPVWQVIALSELWATHYGLGDFQTARRCAFVVDRYEDDIEWDFASFLPGEDFAALWYARRFRRILQLLDRMPRHARYHGAIANDEEHAKMLADAREEQMASNAQPKRDISVPLETWTPEVEKLTEAVDMLNVVAWAVMNQNAKNPSKPPEPSPRPTTAVQRLLRAAEHFGRKRRHESLVAKLLPHKPQSTD